MDAAMRISVGKYRMLVFATALCCLMLELIVSKVAGFYLGHRSSYLAIPITFFGLALGSLHVHFRPGTIERFSVRNSVLLLAAVSLFTFLAVFVVFTRYLPIVGYYVYHAYLPVIFAKMVAFMVLFAVPFYVFGRILTTCYHLNRTHIGTIYAADLVGASLACCITPILFHFISLPEVILSLLCVVSVLLVAVVGTTTARRAALVVVLIAVNTLAYGAITHLEKGTRFLYRSLEESPPEVVEVASRWNEFSRVQLVKFIPDDGKSPYYKIIHDNAQSNVVVRAFRPGVARRPSALDALEMPFLLGRNPRDIMVMFAGCGAEMVEFHEYTGGEARITGVEINGLCKDLAQNTPELASYKLRDFYDLPNIDLRIQEGRSFLIQNQRKFDLIYVGSSAPTGMAFTGHTRKYLYTEQALRAYLDALTEDGILVFDHQPTRETLETIKALFAAEGRSDFGQCVILLRSHQGKLSGGNDDLIVAPGGFTKEEIGRLLVSNPDAQRMVRYAPHRRGGGATVKAMVQAPLGPEADRITDDRPYMNRLDFEGFRLLPSDELLRKPAYFDSWMKIATLILMCSLAALFVAATCLSREHRLPPAILGYLLLTGFVYLLVEVAFIAKLELFLQNPLVSMASVVSTFLLSGALGSATFKNVAGRLGMRLFPFVVAGVIAICAILLHLAVSHLLYLPLIARLVLAAAVTTPTGWVLGMFYPFAVHALVKHGRERSVPITYGVSTLSSVVGATYSMTMMIEWGFTPLLVQAVAAYAILGALAILYSLSVKRNLLA